MEPFMKWLNSECDDKPDTVKDFAKAAFRAGMLHAAEIAEGRFEAACMADGKCATEYIATAIREAANG